MKFAFLAAFVAASLGCNAIAQTNQSPYAVCDGGTLINIRVSDLTPTGTLAGFSQAAAANQNWYRNKGFFGNHQRVGTILERDPVSRTWSVSTRQVATLHRNPPNSGAQQGDEAWKAFVAQYDANSKITSQFIACFRPSVDETQAVVSAVTQLERSWAASYVAGDKAALGALLADDFQIFGKAQSANKTQLLEQMNNRNKLPASAEISNLTVRVDDRYAFAQGLWTERAKDGKVTEFSFTDIWKLNVNGKWQAVLSQSAPVWKE